MFQRAGPESGSDRDSGRIAPLPMALRTLVEDVYADVPAHLKRQYNRFIAVAERLGHAQKGDGAFPL